VVSNGDYRIASCVMRIAWKSAVHRTPDGGCLTAEKNAIRYTRYAQRI